MVPRLVVALLGAGSMVYLGTLAASTRQAFAVGAVANLYPHLAYLVIREETMSWGDFAVQGMLGGAVYATAFAGVQHFLE